MCEPAYRLGSSENEAEMKVGYESASFPTALPTQYIVFFYLGQFDK